MFMTDTVHAMLATCLVGKQSDDAVFTRSNGKPVLSFRGTWGEGMHQGRRRTTRLRQLLTAKRYNCSLHEMRIQGNTLQRSDLS